MERSSSKTLLELITEAHVLRPLHIFMLQEVRERGLFEIRGVMTHPGRMVSHQSASSCLRVCLCGGCCCRD